MKTSKSICKLANQLRVPSSQFRAAFTLVELLVVIVIIGILAALISVAAVNALWRAKQVRIKMEVDQLDAAMKAFKQQYGAYPPSNLVVTSKDPSAGAAYNLPLRQFISKAFPRYNQFAPGSIAANDRLMDDLEAAGGPSPDGLRFVFNPARALVFWLSGFNPDVAYPFTNANGSLYNGARTPLYGFDKTRLVLALTPTSVAGPTTQPGQMAYVPQGGQNVPFVYYDYRQYGPLGTNPQYVAFATATRPLNSWPSSTPTVMGLAVPYALDVNGNGTVAPGIDSWANPDSFQIISAGQDGQFGSIVTPEPATKLYPAGLKYTNEDNDNITNFSDRASLEDARP